MVTRLGIFLLLTFAAFDAYSNSYITNLLTRCSGRALNLSQIGSFQHRMMDYLNGNYRNTPQSVLFEETNVNLMKIGQKVRISIKDRYTGDYEVNGFFLGRFTLEYPGFDALAFLDPNSLEIHWTSTNKPIVTNIYGQSVNSYAARPVPVLIERQCGENCAAHSLLNYFKAISFSKDPYKPVSFDTATENSWKNLDLFNEALKPLTEEIYEGKDRYQRYLNLVKTKAEEFNSDVDITDKHRDIISHLEKPDTFAILNYDTEGAGHSILATGIIKQKKQIWIIGFNSNNTSPTLINLNGLKFTKYHSILLTPPRNIN